MIKGFIKANKFYFYIVLIALILYLPLLVFFDRYAEDMNVIMVPHHNYITSEFRAGRIPFWFNLANFGQPSLFNGHYAFFNPLMFIFYLLNIFLNTKSSPYLTYELRDFFSLISCILSSFVFFYYVGRMFSNFKDKSALFIGSILYGLNFYTYGTSGMPYGLVQIAIPPFIFYTIYFIKHEINSWKEIISYIFFVFFFLTIGYPMYIPYIFISQLIILCFYKFKSLKKFIILNFLAFGISAFTTIPYIYQSLTFSRSSNFETNHNTFTLSLTRLFNLVNPNSGLDRVIGVNGFFTETPFFAYGVVFLPFFIIGVYHLLKDKKDLWVLLVFVFYLLYSSGNLIKFIEVLSIYWSFILKIRSHFQGYIILNFLTPLIIYIGLSTAFIYKKILKKIILGAGLFIFLVCIYILFFEIKFNKEILFSTWSFLLLQLFLLYFFVTEYESFSTNLTIFLLCIFSYVTLTFISPQRNVVNPNIPLNYSAKSFYSQNIISKNLKIDKEFITKFDSGTGQMSYNASFLNIPSLLAYDANYPFQYYSFDKDNLLNSGVQNLVTTDTKPRENYILDKKLANDGNIYTGDTFYIFVTDKALPKYFSPSKVIPCNSKYCKSERDSRELVRYSGKEILENSSKNYSIKILESDSMGVKLEIDSDSRRFIASRENMMPGWSLFVNNQPQELFSVDEGFRGFFVEKGHSEVVMTYFPYLLKEGLIISGFSILFLIVFINWSKIKSIVLLKKSK